MYVNLPDKISFILFFSSLMSFGENKYSSGKPNSAIAVTFEHNIGHPYIRASRGGIPNPSPKEGNTNKSACLLRFV